MNPTEPVRPVDPAADYAAMLALAASDPPRDIQDMIPDPGRTALITRDVRTQLRSLFVDLSSPWALRTPEDARQVSDDLLEILDSVSGCLGGVGRWVVRACARGDLDDDGVDALRQQHTILSAGLDALSALSKRAWSPLVDTSPGLEVSGVGMAVFHRLNTVGLPAHLTLEPDGVTLVWQIKTSPDDDTPSWALTLDAESGWTLERLIPQLPFLVLSHGVFPTAAYAHPVHICDIVAAQIRKHARIAESAP